MKWVLVLSLLLATATTRPAYEPTSGYELRQLEGWKVYVNRRLLSEKPDLARETLDLLAAKLREIRRTIPKQAVEQLTNVPIWVELGGRQFPGMCYHPSRRWLEENGFNPDKAKSIEVGNAANFVKWSAHQPWMVMHELAHAYHHQVLGYDHAGIRSAYHEAAEKKLYDAVLRYDGQRVRAYGMNNDQEYFAEATEAYFGTNDFYPFVRAELKEHDPVMYGVLNQVWGR